MRWPDAESARLPRDLEHQGRAGSVVVDPGPVRNRVEVRAEEHRPSAPPRQVGDDVRGSGASGDRGDRDAQPDGPGLRGARELRPQGGRNAQDGDTDARPDERGADRSRASGNAFVGDEDGARAGRAGRSAPSAT